MTVPCSIERPCGGLLVLDREHLGAIARDLGLDLVGFVARIQSGELRLALPVIARCYGGGHTYRIEPTSEGSGHFVPICGVCEEVNLERKTSRDGSDAGPRRYHRKCARRARGDRIKPVRYQWIKTA